MRTGLLAPRKSTQSAGGGLTAEQAIEMLNNGELDWKTADKSIFAPGEYERFQEIVGAKEQSTREANRSDRLDTGDDDEDQYVSSDTAAKIKVYVNGTYKGTLRDLAHSDNPPSASSLYLTWGDGSELTDAEYEAALHYYEDTSRFD